MIFRVIYLVNGCLLLENNQQKIDKIEPPRIVVKYIITNLIDHFYTKRKNEKIFFMIVYNAIKVSY